MRGVHKSEIVGTQVQQRRAHRDAPASTSNWHSGMLRPHETARESRHELHEHSLAHGEEDATIKPTAPLVS